MARTQTHVVVVSSAVNAAAAVTRGRVDVSGAVDGGLLTFAITNGATGPTDQCVARILVAHKGSAMPAAGAEGTGDSDWKQIEELQGGRVASEKTRGYLEFGPGFSYIEVEFGGNTGQDVTVEAHCTTYGYA